MEIAALDMMGETKQAKVSRITIECIASSVSILGKLGRFRFVRAVSLQRKFNNLKEHLHDKCVNLKKL